MQFSFYAGNSDNPKRYDCASGLKAHPRCLTNRKEIEIDVPNYRGGIGLHKRIIRNESDLWEYLDYALPLVPEYNAGRLLLFSASVCPAPFITTLSRDLFQMYQHCGQYRFPFPGCYLEQPAIYIEASNIIESEKAQLTAEK